jgi:hypothetical protein
MNLAEKIAATYLRLNGFLLLPHFTVFGGGYHGHVDVLGLRAGGSKELAGVLTFPTDDKFFGAVPHRITESARDTSLGLVAEVRTNDSRDRPHPNQLDYVRAFLGNVPVVPVAFFESKTEPVWREECLEVGNAYAIRWIVQRIQSPRELPVGENPSPPDAHAPTVSCLKAALRQVRQHRNRFTFRVPSLS